MKAVVFTLCCASCITLFSQTENKIIQEGNEKYKQNDFTGAQESYNNALKSNPESEAANYNLGNALYQQKNYEQATGQYKQIAESTTDPKLKADAYHNLGNALLGQKKYQESVDAYKQALHSNPDDADTKYNLAYAQSMLKQQQQKQNNQQNKQDQKKQDQDPKPDQQKQQQDKQQQSQPKQYSKDELDRILQALNADDKNVQDKINKQKVQATNSGSEEKDW